MNNFGTFLNNIISSFNSVFEHFITYIELIFNNNFIKLIVYLSLFSFLIFILASIINIIYSIINLKHDKNELNVLIQGKKSENTESAKNGGNIKSKDIYY